MQGSLPHHSISPGPPCKEQRIPINFRHYSPQKTSVLMSTMTSSSSNHNPPYLNRGGHLSHVTPQSMQSDTYNSSSNDYVSESPSNQISPYSHTPYTQGYNSWRHFLQDYCLMSDNSSSSVNFSVSPHYVYSGSDPSYISASNEL